jgi:hypothetical protein
MYIFAKAAHKCIKCGNGVSNNLDPSDRLEYGISALCPDCIKMLDVAKTEDAGVVQY